MQYSHDILRCEALIKDYRNFRRLFRFPYLKEGKTAEQRDRSPDQDFPSNQIATY